MHSCLAGTTCPGQQQPRIQGHQTVDYLRTNAAIYLDLTITGCSNNAQADGSRAITPLYVGSVGG